MFPEKSRPRAKRWGIEYEEERIWIGFYRRVRNDAGLAVEILSQLDADPPRKQAHLGLYLSCRQSLRSHKARQARNKRVAQFVRALLSSLYVRLFEQWPQALQRSWQHSGDFAVETLPESAKEPALAKAGQLGLEPRYATAQADFQQRRSDAAVQTDASPAEAETSARIKADRKTA